MNFDCSSEVGRIVENALSGKAPSHGECVTLLNLPETSSDAALVRIAADRIARQRFSAGVLQGQIGVDFVPCSADCKFCSFGRSHTHFEPMQMSFDELERHIRDFVDAPAHLSALFLMAHHDFDFEYMLRAIEVAKKNIPAGTKIVLNIGDFSEKQAEELRAAGATGSYHVIRLREGIDTELSKESRIQTVEGLKKAGLDWYYCCEPIGPEHTADELAEQILLGSRFECYQHAAMRRINFDHSPLLANGCVTELRLANVLSVTALAMVENAQMTSIAVHEPCVTGLLAGGNTLYAESGGNPRDTAEETKDGRGHTMVSCQKMLNEAGWEI